VFFGNMGAPERLDFTVIGKAVNTASRVEALTKVLGRPVLVTANGASISLAFMHLVRLGRREPELQQRADVESALLESGSMANLLSHFVGVLLWTVFGKKGVLQ